MTSASTMSTITNSTYYTELTNASYSKTNHTEVSSPTILQATWVTWLMASGSVIAISLCGLVPIVCMPKLQKSQYQVNILQFLIGLAIGTLTADALLHLLPHSYHGLKDNQHHSESNHLEEHHEPNHNHDDEFLIGFMALVGIIGFLALERILIIVTDLFTNIRRTSKIDNCSRSNKIIKRTECHSHIPHNQTEEEDEQCHEKERLQSHDHQKDEETDLKLQCIETSQTNAKGLTNLTTVEQCHRETIVYQDPEKGMMVQLTDHHHHHHHQQAHNTNDKSSFIYMIITGDGLHNFFDGLAIGVAFVGSSAGGLSTSIAILCHELPHEIGDFAVLIKSGMSIKRAVLYNTLSSLLCLAGASIGILLGKIDVGWISALIAGMFLYIALVDMVPQLDCCPSQPGSTRAKKLTIQLVGIATGVAIMGFISIFESEFHTLFTKINKN